MSYDVQLQNEADDYYEHENWKGRAEYAEAELESALTLTARYRADARAALARAEAAEALAYERLESAVFAEQRANDAEIERDELRDANTVLSDALETTRQTLVTLTARAAELQAALDAERAAHAWRPVSQKPMHTLRYQVVLQHGQRFPAVDHVVYDAMSGWASPDAIYWRPIPPLPPAPPQEPTP